MTARLRAIWERFGPRARDVTFTGAALVGALAEVVSHRGSTGGSPWLVAAVLLGGSLSLWWRRRHPVAIALVGVGVVLVTGYPFVAVFGLFTLAVRRRDRMLAGVSALAVVAFAVAEARTTASNVVSAVLSGVLVTGFAVAAGAYVGARRDLVAALRERAERAEAAQEVRAEQARAAERSRIAREMHDVLAHKVSLIAMHAGALEVQASPTQQQVAAGAEVIRTTAREAMEDLREVLGVLRADADAGADLAPAPRHDDIARVVEASCAAGVRAELRMDVDGLPDAVARAAHRIVREGLTNVHKHARGASAVVTVAGDEAHGVTVEVANPRPVGAASLLPGAGVGLLGLAERVELLGGTLRAGPTDDGGWRLAAWLPWRPA